jgi:hypothetical protein
MDNQKRECWIKRITEELNRNGEPIGPSTQYMSDRDIEDIKNSWGGAREGAGRKSTGRKKKNYYVTDEEDQKIRELIEQLRKPRE